jgi:tripartite-type tricarboxylate transporter receptor subunit TctC
MIRIVCGVVAAAVSIVGWAPTARAQDYPSQMITIVVPFSAGTGIDVATRIFAEKLRLRLGQPVIVENRGGAGGNMGHAFAAKAKPDGYTLLMAANTLAMNQSLYNLSFDPQTSFAPVGTFVKGAMVLLVNPNVKANSVSELVGLAKAQPGKLNYATPGIGTPQHLAMELFKLTTGADIVHIPHKGASEAVREVVRGEIQTTFAPIQSVLPLVTEHALRALAVSSPSRHPMLPQTPTVAEAIGEPGFDVDLWYGLFVPTGTPQNIVDLLTRELREIIELPDVRARLQTLGLLPSPGGADVLQNLYRVDTARWAKVIKDANIKPE